VSMRLTLARAGLIVTGAFFVSRILGWLRLVVISATFGATGELDAFLAAFRIPDLIFQLVAAGALASALIPVLAGFLATEEEARAWRVASTITNLMMALLLCLAVVVAITAPLLIPFITPGFDLVQTEQTVELTRIMLLSPILLALGAVATSILNASGRFAASAVAPSASNARSASRASAMAASGAVAASARASSRWARAASRGSRRAVKLRSAACRCPLASVAPSATRTRPVASSRNAAATSSSPARTTSPSRASASLAA